MSNDRLTLAAILAFVHAVTSRFLLSFVAEITQPNLGTLLIASLLALVNLALFVFLFTTLKGLLNERHQFTQADLPIWILIGINLAGVVVILLPAAGLSYGSFSLVSKGLGILAGLAWILLGLRLLKLPAGQIKLFKLYAFTVLAAGIGYLTIVVAIVGAILTLVADIILGVIFIQETGKSEPGKIEA